MSQCLGRGAETISRRAAQCVQTHTRQKGRRTGWGLPQPSLPCASPCVLPASPGLLRGLLPGLRVQALPFPVGPVRRFLRKRASKGLPRAHSHPCPAHMLPFPTSPRSPGCQDCPGPPHRPVWPPSAHGFVPRARLPFHPSHRNQSGGSNVHGAQLSPRAPYRTRLSQQAQAVRSGSVVPVLLLFSCSVMAHSLQPHGL